MLKTGLESFWDILNAARRVYTETNSAEALRAYIDEQTKAGYICPPDAMQVFIVAQREGVFYDDTI